MIQPFANDDFLHSVATFRHYLKTCRDGLALTEPESVPVKKPQKQVSKVSSAHYQSKHVYVLSAGAGKPTCAKSQYRNYCAPLWTTIEDETGKRRKVA
jgi:hypothetical protein